MTSIELAKKALGTVTDLSFSCYIYASEGGACGGGYDDSTDLELSKEELLYLIKKKVGKKEVFEGLTLKKIDIENAIEEIAHECAWPDGGPRAKVQEVIPQELDDLNNDIVSLENPTEEEIEEIRARLKAVEGGLYTFPFDVVDGGESYYFAEYEDFKIRLTARQAVALLLHENQDKQDVFKGICTKKLGKDFINEKAEKAGIASDCDYFSYGGECESLDSYLDSWDYIIDSIFDGDITEDNLDDWLKYFEQREYEEQMIEDWHDFLDDEGED